MSVLPGTRLRPAAAAQPRSPGSSAQHGFYVKITVGGDSGGAIDNSWNAAGSEPLSSDPGHLVAGALGYGWGRWRTEVEHVWTDQYVSGPVPPHAAGADTSYVHHLATQSWFGNLYRVFPMGGRLAPYVGLGVGRVQASMDYRVGSQVPRDRTGELIVCLISLLVACGGDEGTFRDEITGYRLFGGADYTVGRFTLDVQVGWMGMTPFQGEDEARNGVLYGVATDRLSSIFGSIGVSYQVWSRE